MADLVIPIPNAVNQQAVTQQLTILGTAPGLGLQLGSPQALGALGAVGGALGIGGIGGALGIGGIGGALGIGGIGGLAGIGGIGGLQGGIGGGLGGLQGLPGGGLGAAGGQPQNLGVGGGALGFGGGQLGQFGNLGGQFGLQGGDQSSVLVQLIRDTVGNPREWARPGVFQRPGTAGLNPAGGQGAGEDEDVDPFPPELQNSLGYYPPARALVVKGTSRLHTNLGSDPSTGRGPGGLVNNGRRANEAIVKNESKPVLDNLKREVAKTNDKKDAQVAKAGDPTPAKPAGNPKKIWQEALEKGVNDPGLIIAVADFLAANKQYDHAAEFLKANLRQGIVVRPWVYEALALALELGKGSLSDIERARVSVVDLEPQDAQGYLRASKAMAEQKLYDRALAFCRQAAILEPGVADPYADALLAVRRSGRGTWKAWNGPPGISCGGIGRPTTQDLHGKAQSKLKALLAGLQKDNRRGEAERMVSKRAPIAAARSCHPIEVAG